MGVDWPVLSISECASNDPYSTQIGPFGEKIRAETYISAGAPILRGINVNPVGRFHDDDFVFIDTNVAEKDFNKFVCEAGDVVLCHKGTLGKIGIIPKNGKFDKYFMGNSMMKVRCDPLKLEPLFLYYWLSSQSGQDYIFSRVSQVGVPQIQRPLSTLREASFPVPPIAEQRTIVHILGTLDDKIEFNRRMNDTLEAMARALFKAWFVDFEPVRAKLDGRWQRGQSLPGLPAHLYDLFPDRLVDLALGEIPEGWRVSTIGAEVTVVGGSTPSTKEPVFWENGQHSWATPKDLSALKFPVLLDTERKITAAGVSKISSGLLPAGTVLLSSRAPIGYLAIAEVPTAINQGFIGMKCDGSLPNVFVLQWCRASQDAIVGNANGSTFQEISKSNFRPLPVVVPPEDTLSSFKHSAGLLHERMVQNERESQTLSQLRDTLLPKLISGALRVPDAENWLSAQVRS